MEEKSADNPQLLIHADESAVYIGQFVNIAIHLNNSYSFAFTHAYKRCFLPLFIWQTLSKLFEPINDIWYIKKIGSFNCIMNSTQADISMCHAYIEYNAYMTTMF